MKGAVSSGHPLTTQAACEILEKGGNAFDAVVAAAFAATVTEPCLSSLGGGGFLLAHEAQTHRSTLYDFFVNSPGKGNPSVTDEPHFHPVEVVFTGTVQTFHAGLASVAVPGMLKGLLTCYDSLCTLDIDDIAAPAIAYLEAGVEANALQQYLSRILMPILTQTDYGTEVYEGSDGGEKKLYNPLYKDFLKLRDPDKWDNAVYGSGAAELQRLMQLDGGLLTEADMREYKVALREPLEFDYRGRTIVTNAAPSFGGELLMAAFGWLNDREFDKGGAYGPSDYLDMAHAMQVMNDKRIAAGGTTHISVMDSHGNAASMTSSNGSNSGCFLGETGVMLNNMMGEDDLHPGGFHAMEPGLRVGSMMSPSIIMHEGRVEAVLGSGGSKRIRTAMLQVIHNIMDRGMSVKDAVESQRMHLDDEGMLHLEPGFDKDTLEALGARYPLNRWKARDLYFGGVHMVTSTPDGHGDSRRGGDYRLV